MNTYEKTMGVGLLWLTRHPTKGVCPERPSGVKDLSYPSGEGLLPQDGFAGPRHRNSGRFAGAERNSEQRAVSLLEGTGSVTLGRSVLEQFYSKVGLDDGEVCVVRQRPGIRQCDQPREQHAAAALEPEPSDGSSGNQGSEKANPCLHGLHSPWPRKESCLSFRPWL